MEYSLLAGTRAGIAKENVADTTSKIAVGCHV